MVKDRTIKSNEIYSFIRLSVYVSIPFILGMVSLVSLMYLNLFSLVGANGVGGWIYTLIIIIYYMSSIGFIYLAHKEIKELEEVKK